MNGKLNVDIEKQLFEMAGDLSKRKKGKKMMILQFHRMYSLSVPS